MRVTVRLFAAFRARAGRDDVELELADGATVDDALVALEPVTGGGPCVLAVDRVYADGGDVLREGQELALIPPVSGGAAAAFARVTDEPLSLDAVAARVGDPRAGAVVTFTGATREVGWLDYEAYAEMAEPVMAEIVTTAIERHGLCAAAVEHRVGRVALGVPSVIVAASAPHRPEAFAGAREIIDEVKARAPIWKAEAGTWVAGKLPPRRPAAAGESALACAAMPTCLVTGGAGFLGSHLCDELLRRGHRVVCVDNLETGSLANIEHIRGGEFVFRQDDIIKPYFVDEPIDFVYHLASPASPIDYLRLPLHTLKVGSHGTHHTLGLAKLHRARFLIASTSEVYGDPKEHPQPETYWGHVNPIGPRGVYDEAKRYAEALTMAYHNQQGVDTAIMRIFNTFGARMRAMDGRAIPTFLRQALQDRPITVFGDGSQTRSFCYVDDLIRGMIALAESGEHDPVNIGNPNEFTLLELAEAVIEVTGSKSEIVFEALPKDDPKQRRPDITRAKDLLGWEPTVELLEGLRMTIEQAGRARLVGPSR